jgi:hypothetical protein
MAGSFTSPEARQRLPYPDFHQDSRSAGKGQPAFTSGSPGRGYLKITAKRMIIRGAGASGGMVTAWVADAPLRIIRGGMILRGRDGSRGSVREARG